MLKKKDADRCKIYSDEVLEKKKWWESALPPEVIPLGEPRLN